MVTTVYFVQSCPVCGRSLKILVTLLGRRVYCQHCGGGFVATDESLRVRNGATERDERPADQVASLIARADRSLRSDAAAPAS